MQQWTIVTIEIIDVENISERTCARFAALSRVVTSPPYATAFGLKNIDNPAEKGTNPPSISIKIRGRTCAESVAGVGSYRGREGIQGFDIVSTLRPIFADFPMHAFQTLVCKVNGLPFEIVLDASLDVPTAGFDWHWVLQFRCIEIDDDEVPTERERQRLEGITIKVVNHLASQADFKFVGSTTYKGQLRASVLYNN